MLTTPDNTTVPAFAPRVVHEQAAELAEATGHVPEIMRVDARRWRLTMANERVCMTMDFKQTGKRFVYARSTLVVDGERRELTDGLEHFARVWADPGQLEKRHPEPLALSEPIEVLLPTEDAPRALRAMLPTLVGMLDDDVVVVGKSGEHFWALEVETDRGVLRVNFLTCPFEECKDDAAHTVVQLVVDGEDCSEQVAGSVEMGLAHLTRPAGAPVESLPSALGPVAAAAQSARSNAVETRRQAVIRV